MNVNRLKIQSTQLKVGMRKRSIFVPLPLPLPFCSSNTSCYPTQPVGSGQPLSHSYQNTGSFKKPFLFKRSTIPVINQIDVLDVSESAEYVVEGGLFRGIGKIKNADAS